MKMGKDFRKELVVLKALNVKPNYAELGRYYNKDPRTIKKYNEGYEGKSKTRKKHSHLDKYKEEIKEKVNLPGSNKKATYEFMKENHDDIRSYSNFSSYIRKEKLIETKEKNNPHSRYETKFGKQLQFDWKETISMTNKYGEVFEFNIFSAILCASRYHTFKYFCII